MNPGRNDPCPCGSGKKYKKCCGQAAVQQHAPASAEIDRLAALFGAGKYAEVEKRARILVGQRPDFGTAWKILGVTLKLLGKDCLPALLKASELMPEDIEAAKNLGIVLHELGRFDEAEAVYLRALRINPDYAEANYNLGNTLAELGRLNEAEALFRRALQNNPNYAAACYNLGNTLAKLERLNEAEACYRQALLIKPDYAEALCNLGNVILEQGRPVDAEAIYRLVLQIRPDNAEAHSNLGYALIEQDRLDEAEASCRRALSINPDYYEAHGKLGVILLEQGRMDEAEETCRQALKLNPDYVEARCILASVGKIEDENLAALEAALSTPLPGKKAIPLHFALGKSYDNIGDYQKAFPHFSECGRLKRATLDYDPDKTERYFNDIMRAFDHANIDRLRGGGELSHLPIFILGMPRSGTSLTEQIIASHPKVYGAGELPDLMTIAQRGGAYPENLCMMDKAGLGAWGADYVSGLQRRASEVLRITDKMPGNFLAVGLIHLMLPNARIIHVNRNPVDTCLSCFTTMFKHGQEHTYDLAELGRYYAGYARLMQHWREVLPSGAFLDIQYEDLVADQEAQSRRLIEYCGLEWNDACLDFHQNKRVVHTASVAQVRKPMYKSSVERWRSYENFLGQLLDALGDLAPLK